MGAGGEQHIHLARAGLQPHVGEVRGCSARMLGAHGGEQSQLMVDPSLLVGVQ
ncbi:hypothetical protein [Cystobacter fuscus]|uniref:hypothetical protein n=1 Tax=Cystobacter fuscus TaxID=43 RepID=UPI00138ABE71|nr:hypothetical protein [Cystobacter fuscus]